VTTPTSTLLHVAGDLVLGPNSATAGASGNYGGTKLGTFQAFRLRIIPRTEPLTEEAYGGEVVDVLSLGADIEATAVLRSWDADALSEVFPNSAAPGGSGVVRQVYHPGSTLVEGQWMTDFASGILLAAFDPNHPSLYLPNAVPYHKEEIELSLSAYDDLHLEAARWLALRDGSDRSFRLASISDIVSTFSSVFV